MKGGVKAWPMAWCWQELARAAHETVLIGSDRKGGKIRVKAAERSLRKGETAGDSGLSRRESSVTCGARSRSQSAKSGHLLQIPRWSEPGASPNPPRKTGPGHVATRLFLSASLQLRRVELPELTPLLPDFTDHHSSVCLSVETSETPALGMASVFAST